MLRLLSDANKIYFLQICQINFLGIHTQFIDQKKYQQKTMVLGGRQIGKFILLWVFVVMAILPAGRGEQFSCLLENNISDACLESINLDSLLENQNELGGYICTVMTMKLRERSLNQGTLPNFSKKAELLCEKMSSRSIENGYNLLEIYLLEGKIQSAFQQEYELFFMAPFHHEAQMAELLPRHKQILESKIKAIGSPIDEAILLLYLDRPQEASDKFKTVTELEESTLNNFLRMRIFQKNSQYSEALQHVNEYLKKQADPHWYFYHLKGNYEMHHIQFKNALESFEKALSSRGSAKDFSFTPYNMGLCYQKMGQFQQSLIFLKRALIADPEAAEIMNAIGFSYYELMAKSTELEEINKHEAAATKYFKDAINKNQQYSVPYYNYGMLLYDRGHFESATKMFKKATELKLNFDSAKYAMFKALYMIEPKRGLKYMNDHLVKNKQNAKDLAILLYQVNQFTKAYQFIKDAVTINRNLDEVYEWKGLIEFHEGYIKDAEESFKMAVQNGNNKSTVFFNLGYVCRHEKRFEEALKYFKRSLESSDKQIVRKQIKEVEELIKSQEVL